MYKKVPNRSHRAEEYNNGTEKYTRSVQQHTTRSRRIDDLEDRAVELTQLEQQKEKKDEKK